MMARVFDGNVFAKGKEKGLKEEVSKLSLKPKLVSILVGENPASILYTKLKQKAGRRIGVIFEIKRFPESVKSIEIVEFIKKLNDDKSVHGIMVQLPLPKSLKLKTRTILNAIDKKKDVDGLTTNSHFLPATVRAVKEILEFATCDLAYFGKRAAVIGANGTVGKGVVKVLEGMGYKVVKCDKDTRDLYAKLNDVNLIVSATGVPGLIKGEMIREGMIAIDVGAPKPDFGKKVYERASFVTPVPGGVGPVTIASLLENLVEAL